MNCFNLTPPHNCDVLPAAIGAGAAIIGAGIGAASTSSSNAANADIMREQNRFNAREAVASRRWSTSMMQYQNWYNSPANQRKLLEEGGFNPYLAYSGIAGTASSSGSAPSGAQASASNSIPNMPFDGSAAGVNIAQSALALAQAKKTNAEANQVDPNAEAFRRSLYARAGLDEQQSNLVISNIENMRITNSWLLDSYDVRLNQLSSNLELTKNQSKLFDAQTASALFNLNNILPLEKDKLEKYIKEYMPADILRVKAAAKCSYAQAAAAYSNALYTSSLKAGQDIKNDYDRAVLYDDRYREAIVSGAVAETHKLAEEGDYWYARSISEIEGYPYIIATPFSFSTSGSFNGLFGIGGSGSVSASGTFLNNPTK